MTKEFFHDDMYLFLDRRIDWARYLRLRGRPNSEVADELESYKAVLRTAGEVCGDIAASARDHWHDEVQLVDGRVVVPPHIAAGYEKLRAAGLICLTLGPAYGGAGLPMLVSTFFLEMLARADASLMTIVGLQAGTAQDIEKYASEELKQRYLPRFATGDLQGAMDLTEPQAGSDLGAIRARARREADGKYLVEGEKIFITNGGADVHLVLAREHETFDQTRGTTNGLSLLLCPRVLPDGTENRVRVSRVEHKLGIHGSPTCVVEFDRAQAYLLGQSGQGFRAMLDLMNNARLGVAAQAVGIAEAAYQEARAYALQRVQFDRPIVEQPLVKQMLTLMAINIRSARALLYRTCAVIDMTDALRAYCASDAGKRDPDRAGLEREVTHNTDIIRFLTPLCKYYATEISTDVTRKGIQVHGGVGFMAESAAGHYHGDAMITTIYEGTSEIQASFALKEMSKGTLFTALEDASRELDSVAASHPESVSKVREGISAIQRSLPALMSDPQYALLNAKRICEMVIDVLISAEFLAQAVAAPERIELANAFVNRRMLAVEMNAKRISSGDASRIKRHDRILGL
jgi:alkylation response protein AidB-like acyl-CoA dehydrogenase